MSYTKFQDYGLPYSHATAPAEIKENIDFLYKKIQQCSREISYYDLYKINTIVNNSAELQSKINSLNAYSSLVINTNIQEQDFLYNIGDLIFKNGDGTISTIKAQRGGIFYPSKVIREGTGTSYSIEFKYSSTPPKEETSTTTTNTEAKLATTMVFSNLSGGSSASPYNLIVTSGFNDIKITAAIKNDKSIAPIIHAYHENGSGQ
jgi:hypothetical protein